MSGEADFAGAELAIVASPPAFHARQTMAALASGLAVLCEKPMATTAAEAVDMAAAAVRSQKPLAIALIRRHLPATQTIRGLIRSGMLGAIRSIRCFEGGPFQWPAQSTAFFDRRHGGGVLADIGVHVLDLFHWWFGMPEQIEYEDDAMGGVEANCRTVLRYPGFTAEVRLSRDWHLPNRYRIEGQKGWLNWNISEPGTLELGLEHGSHVLKGDMSEPALSFGVPTAGTIGINFEQCFVAQLDNVVAAMRGSCALVAPAQAGIASLRMVELCYRTRRPMSMGWLPDEELAQAKARAG
jgi:predicted dehydrogenase